MNEEELPRQQPREIDRSININIEGLERISSPTMPHDIEEDGDPIPQSQNVGVVNDSAPEEHDLIQHNQIEEFEVLNQATTTNVLAAQESRLVGRLWADEETHDADLEAHNEISEETTYTKVLSKSQEKKAEAKAQS
ncbi:unnamed protein product [Lupinus luteus]|uniref:Uncharacterized protein n=1 Tax=Lupinus luteus TaxID=3873 RepID=A0AAV1W762_LUPLU